MIIPRTPLGLRQHQLLVLLRVIGQQHRGSPFVIACFETQHGRALAAQTLFTFRFIEGLLWLVRAGR